MLALQVCITLFGFNIKTNKQTLKCVWVYAHECECSQSPEALDTLEPDSQVVLGTWVLGHELGTALVGTLLTAELGTVFVFESHFNPGWPGAYCPA